jgi:hypothetical protein
VLPARATITTGQARRTPRRRSSPPPETKAGMHFRRSIDEVDGSGFGPVPSRLRHALVYQESHHGIAQWPAQLFGHLDHGLPGAINIAVCRQMNRKAAAAALDLHAYDPEGQAGNSYFDIDEGIQALAVDAAQVRNRERHSFGVGVIGHAGLVRQSSADVDRHRGARQMTDTRNAAAAT